MGCDGCDDWFHFTCLHIPEQFKDLVFSFYCPYCQAGITGKNKDAIINGEGSLPKTLWKRKCRISDCYKPCLQDSKYCSEEHGREFVNDIWSRLKTDEDRAVVKKMVEQTGHIDKFKKFGQLDFIDNNIVVKTDDEKEIFDQIVVRDMTLKTLEDDLQEVQEISLPLVKKKLELLEVYLGWLDNVYTEMRKLDDDAASHVECGKEDSRKIAAGVGLGKIYVAIVLHTSEYPALWKNLSEILEVMRKPPKYMRYARSGSVTDIWIGCLLIRNNTSSRLTL